jgi:hypothetical protein
VHYSHAGNRVVLGRDYIIEQSDDRQTIRIIRPGRRERTMCTVQKTHDQIQLSGRRIRDKRIEFTRDGIAVYHNQRFITGWSR